LDEVVHVRCVRFAIIAVTAPVRVWVEGVVDSKALQTMFGKAKSREDLIKEKEECSAELLNAVMATKKILGVRE
jgi:hypothetical protein